MLWQQLRPKAETRRGICKQAATKIALPSEGRCGWTPHVSLLSQRHQLLRVLGMLQEAEEEAEEEARAAAAHEEGTGGWRVMAGRFWADRQG